MTQRPRGAMAMSKSQNSNPRQISSSKCQKRKNQTDSRPGWRLSNADASGDGRIARFEQTLFA